MAILATCFTTFCALSVPVFADDWWCVPSPGRCHGHREMLVKRASVQMAARLAAPYVVDWDGDGVTELLIGDYDGRVRYYSKHPNGRYYVRKASEDPFRVIPFEAGRSSNFLAATPVAVDFDGDGQLELLLSVEGRIRYYKQHDGHLVEVDQAVNPFRDIKCSWLACRFHAADWDADGDVDLVVPQGLGLMYVENVNGSLIFRSGDANPFRYIVTKYVDNHRGWDGLYSSPVMADWDGDGDLDLLVGQADGSLLYFERTDSGHLVQLAVEDNPFRNIENHPYPAVQVGVLHGKKPQLMIGDMRGHVNLYTRKQDLQLKQRHSSSNPLYGAGWFTSPVPARPLMDEEKNVYVMFQQANVGRVQLFQQIKDNLTLANLTHAGIPQAAATAHWLPAGKPVDVDFNMDGAMDRLNIHHDGRIEYFERQNGELILKNGPDSPFYGVNLDNGLADAKVAGFLPIDWNQDGAMDLLIGAWGLSHLKLFLAGWCEVRTPCNSKRICDKMFGTCSCMTGYKLEDCSGCAAGHFTVHTNDLAHQCQACPGKNAHRGVCNTRGVCHDDFFAAQKANATGLNRLQTSVISGNGSCSCGRFFTGEDCSLGECPAGYEYDSTRIVAACVPCRPGFYKSSADNVARCAACPDGRFAGGSATAACLPCHARFLLYDVSEEGKACTTSFHTNLPTVVAVLLWSLIMFLVPLLLGMPTTILDIRRTLGQDGRVRVQSSGRHFILPRGRGIPVQFVGTGVPQLDHKGFIYRATFHTGREVELLHRELGLKGNFVVEDMASSSGQYQISRRHAMAFLGFCGVPFLVWLLGLFVFYIAFMAVFWARYVRPDLACCFHIACGCFLAFAIHWIRWRAITHTRILKDVQVFDRLLRREHPKPITCEKGPSRAIEAHQLHTFLDFFQNYIGSRTTYYVVHNIILPLTEPYKLSYAEVAGPSQSQSRWFVSHYWGTPLAHLVASVERHAQDFPEKHPYWICTFSNNQWAVSEELGETYHESSFYQALRSCGTLGTVMVFDEEAMPLTRSWCLFELLQTVLLQDISHDFKGLMLLGIMNTGKGSLDLAMNVSKKLAVLDLEAAQASMQSDKDMIDSLVRQEGGFEQINEFLADSINEVLNKLREQFTRNISSLESEVARKKMRTRSERIRRLKGSQAVGGLANSRAYTEPLDQDFSSPASGASSSRVLAAPFHLPQLPCPPAKRGAYLQMMPEIQGQQGARNAGAPKCVCLPQFAQPGYAPLALHPRQAFGTAPPLFAGHKTVRSSLHVFCTDQLFNQCGPSTVSTLHLLWEAANASFMLSYTWGYKKLGGRMGDITDTLLQYCKDYSTDPKRTQPDCSWLQVIATSPSDAPDAFFCGVGCNAKVCLDVVKETEAAGETVPFEDFEKAFGDRVAGIGKWRPYVWCDFEMYTATDLKQEVIIAMPPKEAEDFRSSLLTGGVSEVWAALGAVKVEQDTEGLGTDGEAGPILVEDSGMHYRHRKSKTLSLCGSQAQPKEQPVGKKEIRANPKAQQALDVEWEKLVKKKAWQYETVAEWKVIADKAKKIGKKVHVGKVFEICVEKGSELPEGDKLRKFKGRTVFQGNNVKDESADVALFSELGSSPATMEAGKAVDAYGAQPGFITQQNDGVQAYTQALWKGVETWVELHLPVPALSCFRLLAVNWEMKGEESLFAIKWDEVRSWMSESAAMRSVACGAVLSPAACAVAGAGFDPICLWEGCRGGAAASRPLACAVDLAAAHFKLFFFPTKVTPHKALASATEAIIPPSIAAPSTGGPAAKSDTKRLIVEVCCHPESKLSQTNRKWSEGCEVLQFTEEFDLNEVENQMRIAEYVNSFKGDRPALKLTCCALIAPFRSPVVVMLTRAIQMAKACAVAGRPAILERITQWEGVVNTLKGAIAVATWDDPQVLLREMEGCRLPLANIVEPMLGGGNAEGAYDTLAEVYKNTPDGFLAMCPYPPGGEVDLLIVSDSSLALVPDPNAGKASCFSGGDLLKPWGDIRGIYTKMLWGKGLNHMVQYIPEAIDDIESTNRAHGRPARVERSVNDLGQLKRDEPRILDIVVVGNADADIFALPSAYNETMRVHIKALRGDHGIQTLDTTLMLARTVRYDKVHLEDDAINRKYVTNFLQAVADCHLSYLKLISVDDHLRTLPRIEDLQEQKNYPNLTILKAAYQLEIDSNVSSPQDLPQRPDPEKIMLDADIEIFNWVLQAEENATAFADREVESWMRDIPEEDQALEPMHQDNADSDDEAVKVQALTMEDRIQARRQGLSEEHGQEWQDATYAAEDEEEEFRGWDLIEDDKRPPGVVASDPVHEEEKELDLDDLETVASVEIVDEEEFHDVEEGQAEAIDDDDDDDMAVIDKVSSMQAEKSDARGDPEPMDVDDQGNKMVQSTASAKTWKTEMAQSSSSAKTWKTDMAQSASSAKTWRTDTTAAASAGATPPDPTAKLKPKSKAAKKAMPKRLKVVDEGHGPSAEQFDTSKFATAQDLVWIEPDNMAGVPVRKVDYGRLSSISHAMSDYLRGHRLFHRRPSPEIRRTDLSMDFKALVRHLQGDFAHLREEEVLMVVRNSPMRRFRVQVNGMSSGKLRWTPVRIRAIQGHRAFLVEQGGMSTMIKTMFTFDENFDETKVDDPSVHPAFSAMPEGSPVWNKFPRVVYHTCDQAAFNSIIKFGLIPGGFPPIAIAFDMELMMQMGYKLFATDEAILSPDWISNLPMINAFDMRSGEFFYINRAYVNHRKTYQEVLKQAKAEFDPDDILMSRMEMLMENAQLNFEGIKERIEFGKLLPFSRREDIQVEKSTATREGEPASGSQLVPGYTIAKMAAMTSTDACGLQRRGRNGPGGGNWNRGQGRVGFELQFKDISYNQIQDSPQVRCSHPICGYLMMDGHLKCPRCFRQMEPVTDANIATEVARREAMARTRGVPFSMDKVIFNHPRRGRVARQPEKGSSSSSTAVRTRSTWQLERHGPQLRQIFQEKGLQGPLSPTIERTKAQVLGEKLEMATKLIFVPSSEREPDQPLDLHTEVFVSHRGVFLDIGQFAVYVAKFIKPKQRPLPIVYGWGNRDFVPDAFDAKEIAKELVEFSKLQWSNYAPQQTHKESETTGDDREVSLAHASGPISRPEHERPHHEQLLAEVLTVKAMVEKGKGQQKGKGKQGRSPPGGVAYGDFEGDSYWVQGYRYTWYWNQQRGWYWRWT
ncbi:unnamed protein product [Cladocopium goreaui]|uniref:Uncharacterized protein n=1 Tax=Cladocopium goreaui TaxID=2562237 RepID=A0A9P1C8R1_9DINO|nr:unnamed protein product [Cladocopium goreaui]